MPAQKILLSGARIYRAPVGTADVADTVAFGAAWGGSWVFANYTNAPLVLNAAFSFKDVMVQQKRSRLMRIVTTNDVSLATTFVDFSADTLIMALGGSKSTVAAAEGQPGMQTYAFNTTMPPGAWKIGVEGLYYNAETGDESEGTARPVRLFIPSATASEGVEFGFDLENETGIPVTFAVNEPANNIPFTIRWNVADALPGGG